MLNFLKKKPKGQELKFRIEGMHCSSCAMSIDGALEDTDGVFGSNTSYAKAEVKIDYDSEKLTEKQLAEIIVKQGYKVAEEN
jgi:copper chaperone CopZ